MIIDSYKFAGVPMDADAAAYIARFTVPPSSPMAAKINTFFLTLKSIGVWSKLDTLYLSKGVQDSQVCLLDLKRTTKVAAANGANWSFDSSLGWVTGKYTYTATDYQPGFNGVNLQRDDNCVFAYLTQKPQTSSAYTHQIITQASGQFWLQVIDATGAISAAYINNASVTAGAGTVTSGDLYALRRDSSTSASITKGTTVVASSAAASVAITATDNSNHILQAGLTANATIVTPQGIGAFGAGAFLTTTELGDLKTALEAFWL